MPNLSFRIKSSTKLMPIYPEFATEMVVCLDFLAKSIFGSQSIRSIRGRKLRKGLSKKEVTKLKQTT